MKSVRKWIFAQIIGNSTFFAQSAQTSGNRIAPTDSTVLIYGDTGTGKELIARAVHELSPRRPKAFVKLNSVAIPTALLEASSSDMRKAHLQERSRNALAASKWPKAARFFLDEIGEIPVALQTKLLRVLREKELDRLGTGRALHAAVYQAREKGD